MSATKIAPVASIDSPPIPREITCRVADLTGFGPLHFNGEQPLYHDSFIDPDGEIHPVEVEFILHHICMSIMQRAPQLTLAHDTAGYTCALKEGQAPQQGASMVEAVFRAFAEAKAQARAQAV